ncbi:MAG: L,D-transpeptidase [Candidatus Absconditabacteria bacterium]
MLLKNILILDMDMKKLLLFFIVIISLINFGFGKKYYYDDYEKYDKVIRVNTYANMLTYYEKGNKIGSFSVSAGNFKNPTPNGRFRIVKKHPFMYSKLAKVYMPYWMEFWKGEYGLHGLATDIDGNIVSNTIIGHQGNAGCVRIGDEDIKQLYQWVEIGTYVLIDYNKTEYASVTNDAEIIDKYYDFINNQKYEEAYNLRINRKISLKEFIRINKDIFVQKNKITVKQGGDLLVNYSIYKNGKYLFTKNAIFQVSNGKIIRSYIVE